MQNNTHINVVTYNIHKGFSVGKNRFVLPQIRDALVNVNADLVLLQEIQGEHLSHQQHIQAWPTESQFEYLAESIWPHHRYGKNAVYRQGHHGNAVLSKYPIVEYENIDVSTIKRSSRSLLHATINIPETEQRLHVICLHFSLFKTGRRKQLNTLCERIHSHVADDEPLIIGGDFNDWRQDAEDYLEKNLHMREVFKLMTGHHARTFPAWQPTLQVDRVYFRGLVPERCKRFNNMPWRRLSDHIPLFAEFSLAK